jgi:cytochrome c oxidase cbb3-type subunit 2
MLLGLLLFGSLPLSPQAAEASADDVLERGKEVYKSACASCHGSKGRGDGREARRLGFRPRDLSLGAFKCRSTPSGELPTDEDLFRIVSQGMPGTPMKAFEETLSIDERRAVVEYLKTLSPQFAAAPASEPVPLPEPVPASEKTVAEGKQLYRILKCWSCHGKTGRGDGPAARDLKDDWGKSIRAYDFTAPSRFKCGGDDRDLYRLLHTGMAGSPMPSFDAALGFPREGVEDLSALETAFTAAELTEISDYVRAQPDATALSAMPEEARDALIQRRTWALVHYLRSLLAR